MFAEEHLEVVHSKIHNELLNIGIYDSVKISLERYKAYVCKTERLDTVSLIEMIAIINKVFTKPCIIRNYKEHNDTIIEVCLVKNLFTC